MFLQSYRGIGPGSHHARTKSLYGWTCIGFLRLASKDVLNGPKLADQEAQVVREGKAVFWLKGTVHKSAKYVMVSNWVELSDEPPRHELHPGT